jgi:hypothetical protein
MSLTQTKPLGEWLDAFFTMLETAVETVADVDGLANRADMSRGQRKRMNRALGTVNMELLRARRHVWKRVRDRFGNFGDDCNMLELGFAGLKSEADGTMLVTAPRVIVQKFTDKVPVIFMDEDEITVVCRFFQFYRATCNTLDPQAFVRAALAKKGITAENFLTHPESPAALIRNPFLTSIGG